VCGHWQVWTSLEIHQGLERQHDWIVDRISNDFTADCTKRVTPEFSPFHFLNRFPETRLKKEKEILTIKARTKFAIVYPVIISHSHETRTEFFLNVYPPP
jgi:hypothetical protein